MLRDWFRWAIWIATLIGLIWGAMTLAEMLKTALDMQILPHSETAAFRMMLAALLIYTLLLALPFVPGAEIGVTLMVVFGSTAAPFVYVATVCGLVLAYLIGAMVPATVTARTLTRFRLPRAAELVKTAQASPEAFADSLKHSLFQRLGRHRHLTLMVLLNMPGNFVLGGGGGLSLMAGLSCAFRPLGFVATVAIAVAPVPIAVYALGYRI